VAASLKGAGDEGRDIMGKHKVVVVRAQEACVILVILIA
jgi:hypothetical protein